MCAFGRSLHLLLVLSMLDCIPVFSTNSSDFLFTLFWYTSITPILNEFRQYSEDIKCLYSTGLGRVRCMSPMCQVQTARP